MATKNWNAGIIRPVPVAPTGPYQNGAAPGVWTLDQVSYWQKQGLWPIAGNAAPIGLFGGGFNGSTGLYYNVMDYVTIASTGNATDFGDLLAVIAYMGATSSPTRGVFMGGASGGNGSNVIQYITIASTGNSIDFGDLTVGASAGAATSAANGGLQ